MGSPLPSICEVDYDYAEDVAAGLLIEADLRGETDVALPAGDAVFRSRTPEEILAPYRDPELGVEWLRMFEIPSCALLGQTCESPSRFGRWCGGSN